MGKYEGGNCTVTKIFSVITRLELEERKSMYVLLKVDVGKEYFFLL